MHSGTRGIIDLFLILISFMLYQYIYEPTRIENTVYRRSMEGIGAGVPIDNSSSIYDREKIEDNLRLHKLVVYSWIQKDLGYPVVNPSECYVTSERGHRYNRRQGKYYFEMHDGIDIVSPWDYRVIAANDGTADVGYDKIYGNNIKLFSATDDYTQYSHLSIVDVTNDQRVSKGDIIGIMGNTGKSQGIHLDFMVISQGNVVNPFANSTYKKRVYP